MGLSVILLGLMLGIGLVAAAFSKGSGAVRVASVIAAVVLVLLSVLFSSVRFVAADEVGVVKKNALGPSLAPGQIIATGGEMGIQAEVLPPGWHFGYWPIVFDVSTQGLVEIEQGQVGLVEARDGEPLEPGQLFAPEVEEAEFKRMIEDPVYFLTEAGGRKGPQANVLTPGKYRINPELFRVTTVDATEVPQASVAVLKSNIGGEPTIETPVVEGEPAVMLAGPNEQGVRAKPLDPGLKPINTKAYSVTIVSTKDRIVRFTAEREGVGQRTEEEKPISVRTSDGFTFPVDVRVRFRIEPVNAPVVIAKLQDDQRNLLDNLNSAVRAIFRNNAESVKALDYVNQRSQQESQSLQMLQEEMAKVGVTVVNVFIGDIGNEETLGELLKTQRDREIAVQEQITFQEQQRAAEQKKELTRTQQEAEEERRLATARYEVQIAEQDKEKRLIQASAQAEAVRIEAEAQAQAYEMIAAQVGPGNAALLEMLRVVGERGVEITPRVMVSGGGDGGSSSRDDATVALIGTMLESMMRGGDVRGGGAGSGAVPASAGGR